MLGENICDTYLIKNMHPEFMRILKNQNEKTNNPIFKMLKRFGEASLWEPSDRDLGKFDKPHRETQV